MQCGARMLARSRAVLAAWRGVVPYTGRDVLLCGRWVVGYQLCVGDPENRSQLTSPPFGL
jgi:hypothetical protein